LGVVEVGGDGDHGLGDGVAQLRLGVRFHLLQDHRRDFGRTVFAPAHDDANVAVPRAGDAVADARDCLLHDRVIEFSTHEALDRVDGVLGIGDRLSSRQPADQALAGFGVDRDDGRGNAFPFGVLEHRRLAGLEHRHHGISRSQVDTDYPCHSLPPVVRCRVAIAVARPHGTSGFVGGADCSRCFRFDRSDDADLRRSHHVPAHPVAGPDHGLDAAAVEVRSLFEEDSLVKRGIEDIAGCAEWFETGPSEEVEQPATAEEQAPRPGMLGQVGRSLGQGQIEIVEEG
jgi:hypothetical protein